MVKNGLSRLGESSCIIYNGIRKNIELFDYLLVPYYNRVNIFITLFEKDYLNI